MLINPIQASKDPQRQLWLTWTGDTSMVSDFGQDSMHPRDTTRSSPVMTSE